MDLQLAGKRALITGGSKGLGFGAAKALAQHLVEHLEAIRESTANAVTDVEPKA